MLPSTRRALLVNLAMIGCMPSCRAIAGKSPFPLPQEAFGDVEVKRGGRIGVFALDLNSGRTLSHRANERFAMCSTFKWILGGFILARVDEGAEYLARMVSIDPDDVVANSPVTRALAGSEASIEQLCRAAIEVSDNTAANILLRMIGGPDGFTASLGEMGHSATRLDRYETALNEAAPGDHRDTTTPAAMVELLKQVLFGDFLSPGASEQLSRWMLAVENAPHRLKAGLGCGWEIGHKPGTNNTTVNNDIGFVISSREPLRKPILIASFSDAPGALDRRADEAHSNIATIVLAAFSRPACSTG